MALAADRGIRSTELGNKREIAGAFFGQSSPRVITVALAIVVVARALAGPPSWVDLAIVAVTALLVGPVEWFIHL
ncbi:MAG: hypothetical protein ACR2O6_01390 [Ilumatobacteraceae bacterium]